MGSVGGDDFEDETDDVGEEAEGDEAGSDGEGGF